MRLLLAGLLLAAAALPAHADVTGTPPAMLLAQRPAGVTPKGAPDPRTQTSRQDEAFIRDAALGGLAEIEAGQLAQRKASSSAVRDFARDMVQDHSATNRALGELAMARKIEIPKVLDEDRRRVLADLERVGGIAFDGAYMRSQISEHKQMIQLLESQIASGHDAEVRTFARTTLGTVKRHLETAEQMSAELTGQAK